MTDAETLARLRASDMDPGEFLDALEDTQEMPAYTFTNEPTFKHPAATTFATCGARELPALQKLRDERDRQAARAALWRFSCVASWGFWLLALLVVFWGNS